MYYFRQHLKLLAPGLEVMNLWGLCMSYIIKLEQVVGRVGALRSVKDVNLNEHLLYFFPLKA